jgi:hypothetical protein
MAVKAAAKRLRKQFTGIEELPEPDIQSEINDSSDAGGPLGAFSDDDSPNASSTESQRGGGDRKSGNETPTEDEVED